ncbi:MAG: hypothetical protein V3V55_00970 [Rhodospirillales bacterium]
MLNAGLFDARTKTPQVQDRLGEEAFAADAHIPDPVIARLEGAQNQKLEGRDLCIESIQEIRGIPGVSGVHLMACRQEEFVPEIVIASGVLKNRAIADQRKRIRFHFILRFRSIF